MSDRPSPAPLNPSVAEQAMDRRKRDQDNRERRQDEREARQEERARLQELLLGVLGHDLRNPLSTITSGMGLLIEGGRLDDSDRRIAHRIASAAGRMERMIAQLLDVTRARATGALPIEPEPTDLSEIVDRLVRDMRVAFPDRVFNIRHATNGLGKWDPDRLVQLVGNLIGNAHAYAPHDTVIDVTVIGEPGDGEVSVIVANRGEPIPAEIRETIFEPFHRGATHTSSGLGLGLHISKLIVDAHGGRIDVRSTADEGTTFEVMLPRNL